MICGWAGAAGVPGAAGVHLAQRVSVPHGGVRGRHAAAWSLPSTSPIALPNAGSTAAPAARAARAARLGSFAAITAANLCAGRPPGPTSTHWRVWWLRRSLSARGRRIGGHEIVRQESEPGRTNPSQCGGNRCWHTGHCTSSAPPSIAGAGNPPLGNGGLASPFRPPACPSARGMGANGSKGVSYDEEGHVTSCIFCRIIAGEPVGGTRVLYETPSVVAFRPRGPAASRHFLVVSKRHIRNVDSLRASDRPLLEEMRQVGEGVLAFFAEVESVDAEVARRTGTAAKGTKGSEHSDSPESAGPEATSERSDPPVKEVSAEVRSSALFGFHAPPFNSIDHLHMHCFLPPFRVRRGGSIRYVSLTPPRNPRARGPRSAIARAPCGPRPWTACWRDCDARRVLPWASWGSVATLCFVLCRRRRRRREEATVAWAAAWRLARTPACTRGRGRGATGTSGRQLNHQAVPRLDQAHLLRRQRQ